MHTTNRDSPTHLPSSASTVGHPRTVTSLVDLEEQQCVLAGTVVSGHFGGTLAPIPTWKEVGRQQAPCDLSDEVSRSPDVPCCACSISSGQKLCKSAEF